MTAFWMGGLAATDTMESDASDNNQLVCRQALAHGRMSKFGRVRTSCRVLRVLVVDGEHDANGGLVKRVGRWGHAARLAHDGPSAIQVGAIQRPDVVLLDADMPLMDGCQVARQLRLDDPTNKCFIIAATARGDERHRGECANAGIDLLLIKPIDPEVVETLLMLECERVNRGPTDTGTRGELTGGSQFAPLATVD